MGLANRIIDPWGLFGETARSSVEIDSGKMRYAIKALQYKPDSVVIGTSRVREGISDSNKYWVGKHSRPLSIGLSNGSIYEIYRYLVHCQNINQLESAVIGLDFFSFSAHNKGSLQHLEPYLLQNGKSLGFLKSQLTFSFDMSRASLEKISISRSGDSGINDSSQIKSKVKPVKRKFLDTLSHYSTNVYSKFTQRSDTYNPIDYVNKIIEFCRENKIKLHLYISPVHIWLQQLLVESQLTDQYEAWKKSLTEITDLNHLDLWDFSNVNSVTEEAVPGFSSGGSMNYYIECSHFSPRTGDLIIETILAGKNVLPDFGIRLTNNNLKKYLLTTRLKLKAYFESHPNELGEIQSAVKK